MDGELGYCKTDDDLPALSDERQGFDTAGQAKGWDQWRKGYGRVAHCRCEPFGHWTFAKAVRDTGPLWQLRFDLGFLTSRERKPKKQLEGHNVKAKMLVLGLLVSACDIPSNAVVSDFNGVSVKITASILSTNAEAETQAEAERICAKGGKLNAERVSQRSLPDYAVEYLFICS